jgi:hypothetical protein
VCSRHCVKGEMSMCVESAYGECRSGCLFLPGPYRVTDCVELCRCTPMLAQLVRLLHVRHSPLSDQHQLTERAENFLVHGFVHESGQALS